MALMTACHYSLENLDLIFYFYFYFQLLINSKSNINQQKNKDGMDPTFMIARRYNKNKKY